MRLAAVTVVFILLVLGTACTESGLAEPIPLPVLPEATELPAVTELPTVTLLPPSTEQPTVDLPEPATALPPATPLPLSTPLPTTIPLEEATSLPPATELPTAEPAPIAPLLPTIAPTPEPGHDHPSASIGEMTWPVELAVTPAERQQGLSDRESLQEGTGMLFIFESDQHLSFWMIRMNFPLDMVWIASSCEVVDVTLNAPIPEPGQTPSELPRFSPQSPARFVLEINAGEFEVAGARIGDLARFGGTLAGKYGC